MARVRLFANLRELAGTDLAEIPGSTVGEVLEAATEEYGEDFGSALTTAQVWVDGVRSPHDASVPKDAEVAIIPPVSGGQYGGEWGTGEQQWGTGEQQWGGAEQWGDQYGTGEYEMPYGRGGGYGRGGYVVRSPILMEIGLAAVMAAALFIANMVSLQWLSVAVVLVGTLWAYDVTSSAQRRGLHLAQAPALLAVFGGVLATYRFGAPGMATATVGAVFAVLVWSLVNPWLRSVESVSAGVAVAVTAAFGSSSIVLLRLRTEEEAFSFLFVAAIAVAVSWMSDRTDMPVLDPLVAMIVAAVTSGAIAGAVWAPDLLNTVAASVAAALALVAGRNLGTLLRAGGFFAAGPIPGSLHYLDGVIMASGAFWVLLTVLG